MTGSDAGSVVCMIGGAPSIVTAVGDELATRGATVVRPDGVAAVDDIGAAIDGVVETHGRLDVLVVGALGAPVAGPVTALDAAGLRTALDRHVGVLAAALAAGLVHLSVSQQGRVVVLASTLTKIVGPDAAAEAAACHAVGGLVKAAAWDLGTSGITINAICPAPEPDLDAVAATAALLVSAEGAGITGSLLSIDGGVAPY